MGKRKYFAIIAATCTLSAAAGVMLGYFIFGPIGITARAETAGESFYEAAACEEVFEYENCNSQLFAHNEIAFEQFDGEPEHSFVVTTRDGFIVVYCARANELREVTFTPVNALPPEERERLAQGIRIYSEEALIRILEDYGS
jgi:hypothetical protein